MIKKCLTVSLAVFSFSMMSGCAARVAEDPLVRLYGSWESEDEVLVFVLRPDEEQSLLEKHDGSSVAKYPIRWRIRDGELDFYYSGDPIMESNDPYAQLAWRSEKPRRPDPLRYRVSRDGRELKLGQKYFFRLPDEETW